MSVHWPRSIGPDRRFHLVRHLGDDKIGGLWEGQDTWTGELVTVEILSDTPPEDRLLAYRLRRSLESLRTLPKHPGILGVIASFEVPRAPWFLVMEHFRGTRLADRVRTTGLAQSEAIRVGAIVAEALAATHEDGRIHGGLGPDAVLIPEEGNRPKVINFGLARVRLTEPIQSYAATHPSSPRSDMHCLARLVEWLLGDAASAGEPAATPERRLKLAPDEWSALCLLLDRARGADPRAEPRAGEIAAALRALDGGQIDTPPEPQVLEARPSAPGGERLPQPPSRSYLMPGSAGPHAPAEPMRAGPRPMVTVRFPSSNPPRRSEDLLRHRLWPRAVAFALALTVVLLGASLVARLGDEPSRARPEPSSTGVATVMIPSVAGLPASVARERLFGAGLTLESALPTLGPPGEVVDSRPAAGTEVLPGTDVTLMIGVEWDRLRTDTGG